MRLPAALGSSGLLFPGSRKSVLSPGLVYKDGYAVGEIHAAASRHHGNSGEAFRRQGCSKALRKARGFFAEEEDIPVLKAALIGTHVSLGGAGVNLMSGEKCQTLFKIVMVLNIYKLVIVQPSPEQPPIIHHKGCRFHDMETGSGIGAQSDDVSGVSGNFRLKKHNVYH